MSKNILSLLKKVVAKSYSYLCKDSLYMEWNNFVLLQGYKSDEF